MTRSQRRFALIGDPVSHSVSPVLYEAAFRALRIPARYEAVRIPAGESETVSRVMRDFAASGGGNVTLPHKRAAAVALESPLPAVEATGACNCFWLDDGERLTGDNTDVPGFLAACADFVGGGLEGAEILLLGAGGAARAVAVACAEAGASSLEIRNRTEARARRLVEELGLEGWARVRPWSRRLEQPYDLVVNATRLGLEAMDPLPVELDGVRCGAAIDLVYAPGGTRWTRRAAELGVPAEDGRSMLIHQALYGLERWGVEVGDRRGVLTILRAAVGEALDALDRRGGDEIGGIRPDGV